MCTQIIPTFPFVSDYDEIIREEMKDIVEHYRVIPRIRADNKKMWNKPHHERKMMIENMKNLIATFKDSVIATFEDAVAIRNFEK